MNTPEAEAMIDMYIQGTWMMTHNESLMSKDREHDIEMARDIMGKIDK